VGSASRCHQVRADKTISDGQRKVKTSVRRFGLIGTVGVVLGLALLVAAVLTFARALVWESSHSSEPLSMPISLAPGTIQTPRIKINLTTDYEIAIDLDGSRLNGQAPIFEMSWQLFDSGLVAQGTSADGPVGAWAGTVERTVGRFHAQAGESYMLILKINAGASRLDTANPVLKVQIPRGLWEDYLAGPSIRKFEAARVGALGLIILASSWFWGRKPRSV
jgi:hypothetical protein